MKLVQLCGNFWERLQQSFPPVANHALYLNAFSCSAFNAAPYRALVSCLTSPQTGLDADAVHQYHHAETAPEIGGIHDDVGFCGLRVVFPDAYLAQIAVDGFTATAQPYCAVS